MVKLKCQVTINHIQLPHYKTVKAYAKAKGFDDSYDPCKAAHGSMPSHSATNPEIRQLYIDGHFCYAYKIGIVTNGLASSDTSIFTTRLSLKSTPQLP